MNFIEETIGEYKIRLISTTFTLTVGVTVTSIFILSGDINTGTPVALLTMQTIPTGKKAA